MLLASQQCCSCLAPGGGTVRGLNFANSSGSAIGDSKVPASRRLPLGIIFPEEANVQPLYMYFSRSSEGTKVLEAACQAAGVSLDRGRMIGSPDRLNLFTIEGDLLRVDLDLEAHMGSTLQPNAWIILEKGNRVEPARLAAIRRLKQQADEGGCSIM